MVHVFFCCIFLLLFAFAINLTNMTISFHQLQDCKSYLIVIKMTFSCLQKLLEKCILLFCILLLKFWKGYNSVGASTFLHIRCYIRIYIFYFLEFAFPNFQGKCYIFHKISLIFSLSFLFMQLPRSVIFSRPGHDIKTPCPWPWILMALWRLTRKKALFTERSVFCRDSCREKLT